MYSVLFSKYSHVLGARGSELKKDISPALTTCEIKETEMPSPQVSAFLGAGVCSVRGQAMALDYRQACEHSHCLISHWLFQVTFIAESPNSHS